MKTVRKALIIGTALLFVLIVNAGCNNSNGSVAQVNNPPINTNPEPESSPSETNSTARENNDSALFENEALYIDGRRVVAVQSYYRMTMGGVRSECQANNLIAELYQYLRDNTGSDAEAPDSFGAILNLDAQVHYYMNREISFMESSGLEGIIIQQYTLYSWSDAGNPDGSLPLEYWLIYDAMLDKWSRFVNGAGYDALQEIYELGSWVEIFNDVA